MSQVMACMNTQGSYRQYRRMLEDSSTPIVPYLGVHLTDLTFLADGNVDTLPNGHVHFHKRRMELGVIKDVLRHQNFPCADAPTRTRARAHARKYRYNLVPVPSIATLVRQVACCSAARRTTLQQAARHRSVSTGTAERRDLQRIVPRCKMVASAATQHNSMEHSTSRCSTVTVQQCQVATGALCR